MLFLSTSSLLGYWLHRMFEFTKHANYDGIDICVDFSNFDTFNAEYLKKLSSEFGVQIASITLPEKQLTTEQLEFSLELAETVGAKMINIFPPHRLEKEKNWFGEHLKTLQKKHSSLLINIVNAPPKTFLFIIAEYGDARPETIKKMTENTALSIANIDESSGVGLMRTFYLLGSTMRLVYLSDKKEDGERLFLGNGLMPLESLLNKLKEVGYTGDFTLQIAPEALSAGHDEKVLESLEKAKKYVQKYFG